MIRKLSLLKIIFTIVLMGAWITVGYKDTESGVKVGCNQLPEIVVTIEIKPNKSEALSKYT